MKLKIGILALDIALYIYDFYSGQIRTLVAMATYCFHIDLLFGISTVSLWIIEFYFYRNVY